MQMKNIIILSILFFFPLLCVRFSANLINEDINKKVQEHKSEIKKDTTINVDEYRR